MPRTRTALVIALGLFISLGPTTHAQAVPEFHDGKWDLAPHSQPGFTAGEPESLGMGPDPAAPASSNSIDYGYGGGVEQWRSAVSEACGGDPGCTDYVLGVISCESGGDPSAVGPNGELGILQVDPAYWGTMSSIDQIYFFLNPPAGAWWVCA